MPALEREAEEGQGDPDRLARARQNASFLEQIEELVNMRTQARFGLGMWAWRQRPEGWRETFDHFAAELGELSQLTEVLSLAIESDHTERMPWSDWILDTLQEGEVHAIGSTEFLIEGWVAMALRKVATEGPLPELPPAYWMQQYKELFSTLLENAVDDDRNGDLADVAARVARVEEALESARGRWNEQERTAVIEASLEAKKVDKFCAQAAEALREARIVPDLLRLAGALGAHEEPPEQAIFEFFHQKELFVEGGRMIGIDMAARDIGRKVAHGEIARLVEPMGQEERRRLIEGDADGETSGEEFAERLRSLVQGGSEDAGFPCLLFPIQWRLSELFGLAFLGTGAEPPSSWAVSKGTAGDFLGYLAEAPVFQFPEVPEDLLFFVDLAAWMEGKTWEVADGSRVEVRLLDDQEATERAAKTKGRGEVGEAEMARRWKEQAIITVDPGLKLPKEGDGAALTAIEVPRSFRR